MIQGVKGLLAGAALVAMLAARSAPAYAVDIWPKEGQPVLAAQTVADGRELRPPSFAPLVKELSPAVVNISVDTDVDDDNANQPNLPQGLPPFPGPFLRREPQLPARSLGSGFIVSEDGYIVTNNHVIDKANKIIVRLLDDKVPYTAVVRGIDDKTDIALLQITPKKKLPTVFLGNSDDIEVGDWVLAIGNQFQLGQTVTAGIVSAKSRRVPTGSGSPYDAFIQTDASINPGSSGGPLFNARGQVIGVNTAIFSPGRSQVGGTGFNIGIGFAIPINLVRSIVMQLREHHRVTRGLLGVMIQRIDVDLAEALKLDSPDGALVAEVLKESPAALAGFQPKDVIVSYDGHPVRDHDELPLMVANTAVGSAVPVEVIRAGKHVSLTANIIELKEKQTASGDKMPQPKPDEIGLVLDDLTAPLASALKLPITEGVVVQSVDTNSIADEAGLVRGDVIEEMAGQRISDVTIFERVLKSLPRDKPVLIKVRKSEGSRYLTFRRKKVSEN